jgi:glycosyltransferase involved in cell wall biosynthesis
MSSRSQVAAGCSESSEKAGFSSAKVTVRPKLNMRLVTLCGSPNSKFDAMRDAQDIIERKFSALGITVLPVDIGDWSLGALPKLMREIRRQRPDVILVQYPTRAFGSSLGPVLLAAVQQIAPLVVMLHEFVAAHPLRKLAVGMLVVRARLIATTAERESKALGHWYPWLRGRLRHVPISSNIPGRHWLPTCPPKVIYFGQIRPEKGLETFLECQKQMTEKVQHIKFQIIGAVVPQHDEFAKSMLKIARDRGIEVLLGAESDEVADAIAASTVAVLPFPDGASFRRGSLFAAANCGVPIVTSVGEDTPIQLLSYLDADAGTAALSAQAIRYVLDEKSRLAAHSRSILLAEQFGWDATVDHYVKVFIEAMAHSIDAAGKH